MRQKSGEAGLLVFTALVQAVTAWFLWRACRLRGAPPALSALLLTLGAAAAGDRFVPRPQLFTYLCLAILFERFADAGRRNTVPWFAIPLQAFWTNAHGPLWGLFFGGLLTAGALPGCRIIDRAKLGAGLLLASILHPHGFQVLTHNIAALSGEAIYRRTISEWLPLASPHQGNLPQIPAIWLLVLCGAVTLIAGLPSLRRDWGALLCLAAITAGPITAIRNRDLLAIALAPLAALLIGGWLSRPRRGSRIAGLVAGAVTLSLVVIPAAGLRIPWPRPSHQPRYAPLLPPRLSLSTEGFPEAAAAFLRRHAIGSRIFNAYDYGGYLVDRLRDRKIFIDGRYFIFGNDLYTSYLTTRDGGPEAMATLDRTGTDLLLIRYPESDGYQGLADEAIRSPGWALVFWDDETLLFARRNAVPAAFIDAHAYRWFFPIAPPVGDAAYRDHLEDIVQEARHAAAEAPAALLPRVLLGHLFEYNGRLAEAEEAYREALALKPDHHPALDGLLRLSRGKPFSP